MVTKIGSVDANRDVESVWALMFGREEVGLLHYLVILGNFLLRYNFKLDSLCSKVL